MTQARRLVVDDGVQAGHQVSFREFVLDLESHQLLDREKNPVSLTSMEFDLLKAFAETRTRS